MKYYRKLDEINTKISYTGCFTRLENDQSVLIYMTTSFSINSFRNTIRDRVSNSLDPDHTQHFVTPAVIHLQFWAYGSWDSLFPISMSPNCKLMSPKHYF